MRRFGVMGLMALAALSVSASLASSANAEEYKITELPQLGRCVKASPAKTGEWFGKHCQLHSATSEGEYNWIQGPGVKNKFLATLDAFKEGNPVVLQTTSLGHRINCTFGETEEETPGEYTGAKTLKEKLVLIGCALTSTAQSCTSEPGVPQKETEITFSAEGTLGFTSLGPKATKAGWDLVGISDQIVCGKPGEANPVVDDSLSGSVIAPVTPNAHMTFTSILAYRSQGGTGKQKPEFFVGEPKDVLKSKFTTLTLPPSEIEEQVALVGKETLENEEPLEVKVVCVDSVTKKACT
jgi:hypothetical protein